MSYLFFQQVLEELGHKVNYEGVSHLAANSNLKDPAAILNDNNPLLINGKNSHGKNSMGSFFGAANITRTKGSRNSALMERVKRGSGNGNKE